jgi:hypothetical protein
VEYVCFGKIEYADVDYKGAAAYKNIAQKLIKY